VKNRGLRFWMLQLPGWALLAYLVYAQAIPALNYELGISMGTQEPASAITEVGVAFWYGFALADALIYIPLMVAGLIGTAIRASWGRALMAAALGITLYWPIVSLAAVVAARDAAGWKLSNETAYWLVLPLITLWAAWGIYSVAKHDRHVDSGRP